MCKLLFPPWIWLVLLLSPATTAGQNILTHSPFVTHQGQKLDFGPILGQQPIYIKFWASWCVPCNEQMPHFQQAY